MKPDMIDVLTVMMMKAEVARLYEEIDKRVLAMKEEFGAGRFDYEIGLIEEESDIAEFAHELKDKGEYFKFEIEDNLTKLQSGESIFKSVSMKPLSFSSRTLKHCPESLKGMNNE